MTDKLLQVEKRGFFPLIFAAYLDFSLSFRRQNAGHASERSMLLLAFSAACILFMANLPVQLVRAFTVVTLDVEQYIGLIAFVSVFFMPLFLYLVSGCLFLLFKIFRGTASFFESRLAFFWSLNVAGPVIVIDGLFRGFFFDHQIKEYVSLILQLFVAWIIVSMLVESEQFKSKLPTFCVATVFVSLPLLSALISS